MADKIKVTICSGTACYVMGASDLLLLEENLPENLKDRVEIEGENCLGYCKDSKNGRAPYVLVNGELMAGATVVSVIAKVQELADA
jgi:NADH:ubiquinone oxidoreductase subunit E